ncbi:MAG: hypothetical protein ABEK50_17710 [bacterium]
MSKSEKESGDSSTSIRKLNPPTFVKEAYNKNGILVAKNINIKSDDELERLLKLGVKSYDAGPEDTVEETEESTEKLLSDTLPETPSSHHKTRIEQNVNRYQKVVKKL